MIRLWINKSYEHLNKNNTYYLKHLKFASRLGILSIIAGLVLLVHSLFPCWFEHTGSNLIAFISGSFKNRDAVDDT